MAKVVPWNTSINNTKTLYSFQNTCFQSSTQELNNKHENSKVTQFVLQRNVHFIVDMQRA